MKAIVATSLDSLDAYAEAEVPLPEPGVAQLRIKVAAIGIGYVDALVALGRYQVKPPLPHTPGSEFAGIVDKIGEGCGGWAVGDRVMGMGARGMADYALAPVGLCAKLPDTLSFAQGAALPLNYLTALHALVDRAAIRAGETLLVMGAAGGVGIAAVQIGRLLGAHVIAAGSTAEKRDFAVRHGAHASIDTDPDGWRDRLKVLLAGKPLGVIADPVCGPLFEPAFRSLGWAGRHLVIGFVGGPIPALPSNLTLMKGSALIGVDERQFVLFEPDRAAALLQQLGDWTAEGRLVPPVGKIFQWQDAAAALSLAIGGKAIGKTVLMART